MKLPLFPPKTLEKMRSLGLSESQLLDVFNTGIYGRSENGTRIAVKSFPHFEIGVMYDQTGKDNQYVITEVWKKQDK